MANCPKCGSPKFRYELRSAGTKSSSSYYRTGVKNSWFLPAGEKTRKSERMQKAVGICPDCGYVEDKQQDQQIGLGCLALVVFVVCIGFIFLSMKQSTKDTATHNTVSSAFVEEQSDIDAMSYSDIASFEAALNDGEDVVGSVVTFTIADIAPDSKFGYNLQAGEHLNFCSDDDPKVSVGDTVTVKVTDVSNFLGSFVIRYTMRR